jgi:chromosome segregation ATPase
MSAEFSNTYQEILLDNLIGIIKQNFLLQTQLKIAETSNKNYNDLKKQFDDLTGAFNNAKQQLTQMDSYKSKAEANTSAHEEKNRIQSALNDSMRKYSDLQKVLSEKNLEIEKLLDLKKSELNEKQKQIEDLKTYVGQLEEIAPVTKLKKLNPIKKDSSSVNQQVNVFEEKSNGTKIENKIQKVVDGSNF